VKKTAYARVVAEVPTALRRRSKVHTEFSRFVIFWTGASLCLVYLAVMLVKSGVIRWGETGATTIAYLCIGLIFLDLLFLLEYMSVLYEKDDKQKRGDQ
jgi:predicted membrane channel-forming protein YqfA (hemolysin III family)